MAIGVFFILMMLIVQLGFLVLARNAASTSVDAALRRASVALSSNDQLRERLERDVDAVVPGVESLLITIESTETEVHAQVRFRWRPPGPDFVPVTVSIDRSVVRVVPP